MNVKLALAPALPALLKITCVLDPATGPVAPVLPITPVAPVAPVAPLVPDVPVAPVAPFTPATPVAPVAPIPVAPVAPLDGAIQLNVFAPSVLSTYPLLPPAICKLLTLPNVTFDALEKFAVDDIII